MKGELKYLKECGFKNMPLLSFKKKSTTFSLSNPDPQGRGFLLPIDFRM